MPGRNPTDAFKFYADPLKAVFGCICREPILQKTYWDDQDSAGNPLKSCSFANAPVRLRRSDLAITFEQYFRVVWSDRIEAYKVQTESYTYEVESWDSRHELFAFHWEPNAPNSEIAIPHMHIGFGASDPRLPINNKAHVPTGRVPVEDFVTFLICELRAEPLNAEWEAVIRSTREKFMRFKSW